MVGETQAGGGLHCRHMTFGTGMAPRCHRMARRRVALSASTVVRARPPFHRDVGTMATQTAQPSIRAGEASTGCQHQRLVTRIPGIGEPGRCRSPHRHAMTGAAQVVDPGRAEASGIHRPNLPGVCRMAGRRTVTVLAPDPQLRGLDGAVGVQRHGTGRMAREAAEDTRGGIEDPVAHTSGIPMSRRRSETVEAREPAFTVFQIVLPIQPADKRNRLGAGSKRPLARLAWPRP